MAEIYLLILFIGVISLITVCVYIVLKTRWKRDDKAYFEIMDSQNYSMQYPKSHRATAIAILVFATNFALWPMFFSDAGVIAWAILILLSVICITPMSIHLHVISKFKVTISGDVIEANVPFRGKRTFTFDEIEYVIEETVRYAIGAKILSYPKYRIFVKDSKEQDVNVFSVTNHIHGYEHFESKLKAAGKIDAYESELRERVRRYKQQSWVYMFMALLAASIPIYVYFSVVRHINYSARAAAEWQEIRAVIIIACLAVALFVKAVQVRVVGRMKVRKWKQQSTLRDMNGGCP